MKPPLRLWWAVLPVLAGCATTPPPAPEPPMRAGGPNWAEIDKTVQRVKAREQAKPQFVETSRTVESGFRSMSEADYATALDNARDEVRRANPKFDDAAVEREAVRRADRAKWDYEHAYSSSGSSSYELKKP